MDLPSPRELELETLLRQRDAQLAELGVGSPIFTRVILALTWFIHRTKLLAFGSIYLLNQDLLLPIR